MATINAQAPFRFEQFHGTGLAIVRCHEYGARGRDPSEEQKSSSLQPPPASSTRDAIVEFAHLAFTFPLKLISPRSASRDAIARIARAQHRASALVGKQVDSAHPTHKPVAALYIVGYGGGLVSGDTVAMDMDVGQGCTLLLLTQGSTKVYKMRAAGLRKRAESVTQNVAFSSSTQPLAPPLRLVTTSQTLRCIVRANATLVVLPDPVTCFASARYSQTQRFDLRSATSSSLVVLDWFTPGRIFLAGRDGKPAASERWAFASYQSRNEVRIDGHVAVRDVLLLERDDDGDDDDAAASHNSIAQKCDPYTCYATLILCGPDVRTTVLQIRHAFHAIQQHSRTKSGVAMQDLLWSCTPFTTTATNTTKAVGEEDNGLIVRVAGLSTELVRGWLRENVRPLTSLVGDDLYRQALG